VRPPALYQTWRNGCSGKTAERTANKISLRVSARCQRANTCKIENAFRPPATFVGWNFGAKLFVEVKSISMLGIGGKPGNIERLDVHGTLEVPHLPNKEVEGRPACPRLS
jgi:hypothetical protein